MSAEPEKKAAANGDEFSAGCLTGVIGTLVVTWGLGLFFGIQGTPNKEWGVFSGDPQLKALPDGRNFELLERFVFVDRKKRVWTSEKGSKVNGASIPRMFWSTVGGPMEGQYRNASILHDTSCENHEETWKDVHRMFYEGCRCGGVPEVQAKLIYGAVYNWGPRWETQEVVIMKDGQRVRGPRAKSIPPDQIEKRIVVSVPIASAKRSDSGEKALKAFIESKNPSLEEIEQFDVESQ